MKYAVIDQSGNVVNTIEWDGAASFPHAGLTLVQSDTASPGGTYANGVFTPPPPQENN